MRLQIQYFRLGLILQIAKHNVTNFKTKYFPICKFKQNCNNKHFFTKLTILLFNAEIFYDVFYFIYNLFNIIYWKLEENFFNHKEIKIIIKRIIFEGIAGFWYNEFNFPIGKIIQCH